MSKTAKIAHYVHVSSLADASNPSPPKPFVFFEVKLGFSHEGQNKNRGCLDEGTGKKCATNRDELRGRHNELHNSYF